MAEIDYLPVWKRGSTPAEWFDELRAMALKHPEWFTRCAVVAQEDMPDGQVRDRNFLHEARVTEALGMLHLAMAKITHDAHYG